MTILPFPVSQDALVRVARGDLAAARYRLDRACENLDARNPANWGCFQWARERVEEAEGRLREAFGSVKHGAS